MVHSICRAPASTAARLFAVAMPRSLWQWVAKTISSAPGTRSISIADEVGALARRGVADGVGDVDRRRAGLDRDLDHPAEIVVLGPRRVHRRPLHVVAEVARVRHRLVDPLGHLVHVEVRDRPVQRRGADEGVDARPLRVPHRLPAAVDVLEVGAGEAADHRVLRHLRDAAHRLEVAVRGDREARLDDVDAHLVEERRDLQLLLERHGGAGRLLAVAEGGVEDEDAVLSGVAGRSSMLILGLRGFLRRVRLSSERARRTRARSEAAKQKQPAQPAMAAAVPKSARVRHYHSWRAL